MLVRRARILFFRGLCAVPSLDVVQRSLIFAFVRGVVTFSDTSHSPQAMYYCGVLVAREHKHKRLDRRASFSKRGHGPNHSHTTHHSNEHLDHDHHHHHHHHGAHEKKKAVSV